MGKMLLVKLKESALSVLPITTLVAILAATVAGIGLNVIWLFLIGAVLLILGMTFFSLGADIAMMPIGQSIGSLLPKTKKKNFWVVILIVFIIGFVITIAEPDLLVLAKQLGNGSLNIALLCSVAAGVGLFLVVSILRTFLNIKLRYLLLGAYVLVFALGIVLSVVNPQFLALSFDSGGVTTGPITVPFLMAMGLGLTVARGSKDNQDDSFGVVALCSVGPILAVMILGITGATSLTEPSTPQVYQGFVEILEAFGHGLLETMQEILIAIAPIAAIFFLFQFFSLKLPKKQVLRIVVGILYTFIGLTVFLTGVSVGFAPMGFLLGEALAEKTFNFILIPIGMVMGCLVVLAEPAIHVLNKQVEEVTGGAISKKSMMVFLAAGVAISVGLAMLRVLTGLSIWWFLVPVYTASLILMFFVPSIFSGIAFDSGGVASGPMTATFMLPMAIGACGVISDNIFTDAYGLVAFVAMTPLIAIQLMGLIYKLKTARIKKRMAATVAETATSLPDGVDNTDIIEFDGSENITLIDDGFDKFDTASDNQESTPQQKTTQSDTTKGDINEN